MQFLIIVIFFCSFIFLYALHLLVEDDFVILRKNITTEKIFNVSIAMGLTGLFFARLFYVLFNPKPVFFEILGFLIFPYFPGLSLMGGIIGALGFYFLSSRKLGFPIERVFDFLLKSFLAAAPFGVLGVIVIGFKITPVLLLNLIAYLVLFFIAVFFSKKGEKWLKDGSFGFLSLIFISAIWIASTFVSMDFGSNSFLYKENSLALFLIMISLVFLIKNEATRLKRNGR